RFSARVPFAKASSRELAIRERRVRSTWRAPAHQTMWPGECENFRARTLRESVRELVRALRFDFAANSGDKFINRLRAQVAFRAMAHRNGAGFGLFATDNQHVRNLLQLRVANFGLQLFVSVVEMNA